MKFFQKFFDAFEVWLVGSGFLDQLSFVVTKTTAARSAILWLSGILAAHGVQAGSYKETLTAGGSAVLVSSVNIFINYIRNKYAAQVQQAVGAAPDKFIYVKTVAAAANVGQVAGVAPTPAVPDPAPVATPTPPTP